MYQKLLTKQQLKDIALKWRQPGHTGKGADTYRKGHIRQTKSGSWRAQVDVYCKTYDKTFKTKREARRFLAIKMGKADGLDTRYVSHFYGGRHD